MKITKAECLEFLRTNKVDGQKSERVYGLFVLVEKFNGKWPSAAEAFKAGVKKVTAKGSKVYALNGYTRHPFGRMVWAKNEIKRRENAIKEWEKNNPMHMYDHINVMQALSCSPNLRRKCVHVPMITDTESKSGSSSDIPQRPFLNKVLSEKMRGQRGGVVIIESTPSSGWLGINWAATEKAYEANKLKAEQEEKKMCDSNAELKEGDKAILNNDQGFILHYGAELVGHEVEIVKFFSKNDIELAAVEYKGSVYCFRKSMLKPAKTERQKAVEFYLSQVSMGMVQSVYKTNKGYYRFAIESLIDNGHLNTKTPPVAR